MNTLASTKKPWRDLSRRSIRSEWLDGADASCPEEELALVLRAISPVSMGRCLGTGR